MSIDFIIAGDETLYQWDWDTQSPTYLPQPSGSVLMASYNDGIAKQAYLYTNDGSDPLLVWPVGSYIVGAWDREQPNDFGYLQFGQTFDIDGTTVLGTPTYALQLDYPDYIRPLGNDAAGVATGLLDSLRWQGAPEGKFLEDSARYATWNAPFTIEFTRQDFGSGAIAWDSGTTYNTGDYATSGGSTWVSSQDNNLNNTPFGGSPFWDLEGSPGWGWKAEMLSDDPLRDITARAIAIYSDPAWTSFLYTTGAFVLDGGTGLYTANCPPGNRTATPDPVYYSLLWGSIQEGNWQLLGENAGDYEDRLHWGGDQGAAGYFGVVDSGGGDPVVNTANVANTIYSPDGHALIDLDAPTANKLQLILDGNAQDTLDPTLTFHFPTGPRVIPMTFVAGPNFYQSGNEMGIRTELLSYAGWKVRVEITWA